tara:strand:- start:55 stop:348 length:294 start_codon:yes stop_codon:yes gene_type:complete
MGSVYKVVRPRSEEDRKKDEMEKEEHILNYIRSIASIDKQLEPFKEQKRDLKTNYVENGWLSKEEVKLAMKAYRMIKSETDWSQLSDLYEVVKRGVR